MNNIKLAIVFSLFCATQLVSQTASDTLPTVLVNAQRSHFFGVGQKKISFDSAQIHALPGLSLLQFLTQRLPIALKNYSAAGLSTLSIRGAGAHQTALIWNGFDLRSSMNGMSDLQLLPVFAADAISFQPSAPVSLSGAAALGGAISFENKHNCEAGWHGKFQIGTGSWGEQQTSSQFSFKNKNVTVGLRNWWQRANNNYPVRGGTASGSPRLEFAEQNGWGVLPSVQFFFSEKNKLEVFAWQQHQHRQIPPSRTAALDSATQVDDFQRLALIWTAALPQKWLLRQRFFGSFERIFYESLVEKNARSQAQNWVSETELHHHFEHLGSLNMGLHLRREVASLPNLEKNPQRDRWAMWAAWQKKWRNTHQIAISARQEMVENRAVPITFSVGGQHPLAGRRVLAKYSAARNFNLPTFNQMYWARLGNPNLSPEKGWSAECGSVFYFIKNENPTPTLPQFSLEITHFQSLTNNWIEWRPGNDGWFRPNNVLSVWSRGAEVQLDFLQHFTSKKWVKMAANYAFTHATRHDDVDKNLVGKQLTYQPRHQFSVVNQIQIGSSQWMLAYRFSSRRFTETSNSEQFVLPSFGVWDAHFSHHFFQKSRRPLTILLGILNVLDKNYELISFRPMAGRSWRAELRMPIF